MARAAIILDVEMQHVLAPYQVHVRALFGTHVTIHQHPVGTNLCLLYVADSDGTVSERGIGDASECEA